MPCERIEKIEGMQDVVKKGFYLALSQRRTAEFRIPQRAYHQAEGTLDNLGTVKHMS